MLLCLSLAAFLSSCAAFQNKHQIFEETERQAQSQVALGDYQKALALYAAADDRAGHDPSLHRHYARTGDLIRSAADTAFQQGSFSQAGGIYHILRESGITERNLQDLSFDMVYLLGRISSCSNSLMELGLVKYREDNLDEAFSIWSKVLAFDPGNRAITKALETTSKQRKMLKNIGSASK
jgi:tetratricopeptide (TPR) repeat protein